MKKAVNLKKNPGTELKLVEEIRQVKSTAELRKLLNIKREQVEGIKTTIGGTKAIDGAHIADVQVPKHNQYMPSKSVGGTKSQLVGAQGTNTKQIKQCGNVGRTKTTTAERPNKSSLNIAGSKIPPVEGPNKKLHIADVQVPKHNQYMPSRNVGGTKSQLVGAQGTNTKQIKQCENSGGTKATTAEGPNKKLTKRNLPSFSLASHALEKKSKLSTSNESQTKVSDEVNSHVMKKGVAAVEENGVQVEEPKETPKMPGFKAMTIDNFLKENGMQVEEDEELELEGEEEDAIESEGEIAPEEEGSDVNGTTKKRTRGPTRCLHVRARDFDERVEITLDSNGEPIGPTDKDVAELSSFIGTVAKNATYCPLIYTSFKAFTDKEKLDMWNHVNDHYIIPTKGKKTILARINDAWRRYKTTIKKKYFSAYPNLRERLKHRPKTIPNTHFKKLMIFWGINTVQDICKKNAVNRAKQKYIHRMGTRNFARIKAQMRAKKEDGSDVTQAEMFIETRTSRKGKEVDQDTQNVITKLHESIEDSNECARETFQSIFGKEKAGRVRCSGRTVTPTVLKRNEEIADIKRQCSIETTQMAKKLNGLQGLVRILLKQNNPDLDDESLDNIMENAMENDNGASTSTHNDLDKEIAPIFEDGELRLEDD